MPVQTMPTPIRPKSAKMALFGMLWKGVTPLAGSASVLRGRRGAVRAERGENSLRVDEGEVDAVRLRREVR